MRIIMNRIAKFEKVSYEQFKNDWKTLAGVLSNYTDEVVKFIYDNIELPVRATKYSAGYDFKAPISIFLLPNDSIKIPTGIRVKINDGWVLKCYPRSGFGFKYRLQLDNTVGIIDSDYYYSDNEGHIFAKITNDGKEGKEVVVNQGEGFMQGIFVEYGITEDDDVENIRNGGFGSTTK
jgi:dUTP pyrophosphatase